MPNVIKIADMKVAKSDDRVNELMTVLGMFSKEYVHTAQDKQLK